MALRTFRHRTGIRRLSAAYAAGGLGAVHAPWAWLESAPVLPCHHWPGDGRLVFTSGVNRPWRSRSRVAWGPAGPSLHPHCSWASGRDVRSQPHARRGTTAARNRRNGTKTSSRSIGPCVGTNPGRGPFTTPSSIHRTPSSLATPKCKILRRIRMTGSCDESWPRARTAPQRLAAPPLLSDLDHRNSLEDTTMLRAIHIPKPPSRYFSRACTQKYAAARSPGSSWPEPTRDSKMVTIETSFSGIGGPPCSAAVRARAIPCSESRGDLRPDDTVCSRGQMPEGRPRLRGTSERMLSGDDCPPAVDLTDPAGRAPCLAATAKSCRFRALF